MVPDLALATNRSSFNFCREKNQKIEHVGTTDHGLDYKRSVITLQVDQGRRRPAIADDQHYQALSALLNSQQVNTKHKLHVGSMFERTLQALCNLYAGTMHKIFFPSLFQESTHVQRLYRGPGLFDH